MDTCFKAFDKDEDGFLNQHEFGALCKALFRNEIGKPYPADVSMLSALFSIFDTNKDNVIDKEEFRYCWQKWIKQVVRPVTALVVVDVQNDFITGTLAINVGSAGHNGEEVISPINMMLEEIPFDVVIFTLDWHPKDHISFLENAKIRPFHKSCKIIQDEAKPFDTVYFNVNDRKQEQKLWPAHCIQNSWGAELHKNLKIRDGAVFVKKGTNSMIDSYSAFWDNNKMVHTTLDEELSKRGVTDVYVCGLAYEVCVAATAIHANEEGYRTVLIDDASRGLCEDDIAARKQDIVTHHGAVVQSSQVKNIASGRDRPPELAFKLALELTKKKKMFTQ